MPTETSTRPAAAPVRPARQELVGIVTSAKMQKTIVVKVARLQLAGILIVQFLGSPRHQRLPARLTKRV